MAKDYKKKQAKLKELTKPKVYPKGVPVYTYTRAGINVDINQIGQHRAFSSRGKMVFMNRKEARTKNKDRDFTKPNYEYRLDRYKLFNGHKGQTKFTKKEIKDQSLPAWRINLAKEWDHPQLSDPVSMSNHDRHTLRAAQRKLAKLKEVKA